MNKNRQTHRLRHIDIAKGIGIICVVWGHSLIEYGHYIIYMFHMPLFFYLSGIFHKDSEYNSLVRKKINGLINPLLAFIFLLTPLSLVFGDDSLSITPPHLKRYLGPLWFLWALFLLSILYHPFMRLRLTRRLVVCFIVSFVLGYIPHLLGFENWGYVFTVFSSLVFYCLGNVWGDRIVADRGKMFLSVMTLLLSVALCLAYILEYKVLHYDIIDVFDNHISPAYGVYVAISVVGIALIICISKLIDTARWVAGLLALVGECSLYIFALHMPLMLTVRHWLPYEGIAFEIVLIVSSLALGFLARPIFKKICPTVFK